MTRIRIRSAGLLMQAMEEISERCWCAGWMGDLEYSLWDAIQRDGDEEFGMGTVTHDDKAELRGLSRDAGAWVMWANDDKNALLDCVWAVPIDEWKAHAAERGSKL